MVYPHVIPSPANDKYSDPHEAHIVDSPSSKSPRFVESPESVKYCAGTALVCVTRRKMKNGHTKGRKMMDTISSSFSVSAIVSPPSRGTMIPVTNAPADRGQMSRI